MDVNYIINYINSVKMGYIERNPVIVTEEPLQINCLYFKDNKSRVNND